MSKLIFSILVLGAILFQTDYSNAQCDAAKHKDKCVAMLAEGFTFVKSFVIDESMANENGEVEYSFVFSKGTLYMLTVANSDGEPKDIEIKLYDPTRKLLATNYDKKNDKYIPVGYPCSTTGIHYMSFTPKGSDKCGLSVLGFKR